MELRHTYTCILSPPNPLPSRLPHNVEQSSLGCTLSSCWLSILNTAVCTCPSQTSYQRGNSYPRDLPLSVFVCSGCYNKVPQTGQLQRQKLIFSSSGGWKSKIKVSAKVIPSEDMKEGLFAPGLYPGFWWVD